MRHRIKKNIINIMQTMLEAHNHAVVLLLNKHIVEANDILSQCQDCAVRIGETIEQSEGVGSQAVSDLEAYCELLYQMSQTLDRKKLTKLNGQLDAYIRNVEYLVNNKIFLDKQKVVFMPYKASMWDCMESIWKAAMEDEKCETYVVPIPYYERNQDGSIKRLCYEGELLPKYVPIVAYKKFLVEIEKPDVIYIHNPYDETNYVTSVHPDYYSYNLKKSTDTLVYIPYFILGDGPMPESHRNLTSYHYIDKIVVQDKKKAESLSDYINEDKIVEIGSPKVDYILKMNRRKKEIIENNISKEWREIIINKKVILYNVSISGLLKNSQYAMDKIRYVLSEFENRKDVVLFWRPHPLLEATLQSMRPELYDEYKEIKNSFINDKKGIFDETGDPAIATVIADAYLGEDSSSLVHYFGILGKPIYYINWELLRRSEYDRTLLSFSSFFKEENNLYFVPRNRGQAHDLHRLDLKNGIREKIMTFPGIPDNVESCYLGIKKVENKIILIPYNTCDIYIYDIKKEQAIKIVLSETCSNTLMFSNAVEYNGKIFLLPIYYPAIVSIDIQNLEVNEYKQCVEPFFSKNNESQLFTGAHLINDKYLYLASGNDNRIIKFDMEDGNYEIKKIGNYACIYGNNMLYDGHYFWLAVQNENYIVRWDEKSGDTKKYIYPTNQTKEEIWSMILNRKNEIVVFYGLSLDVICIDKQTGKCKKEKKGLFDEIKKRSNGVKNGYSFVGLLDPEIVVLIEWRNNSVNMWDMHTDEWTSLTCRLTRNEMLNVEKEQIEKYFLTKSTPYSLTENVVTIPQYIDYIASGNTDAFKNTYECYQNNTKGNIGEKIHEYIKNKSSYHM